MHLFKQKSFVQKGYAYFVEYERKKDTVKFLFGERKKEMMNSSIIKLTPKTIHATIGIEALKKKKKIIFMAPKNNAHNAMVL